MKSERITVLGSHEFKAFLMAEAEREGISVSELVRRRCERAPSEDEIMLENMAAELKLAVQQAQTSLEEGLAAVYEVLNEHRTPPEKKAA